jgi:hypothetical protein
VGEEGPGQGEQLALAGRERDAALVHRCVQAGREALDHVPEADTVDRFLDVASAASGRANAMLSRNRPGEQVRLLRDDAELAPQRLDGDVAQVVPVDQHASGGGGRRSG